MRASLTTPADTGMGIHVLNAQRPGPLAVAPDGSAIVFTAVASDGESQLWVRRLNRLEATPLAGTAINSPRCT